MAYDYAMMISFTPMIPHAAVIALAAAALALLRYEDAMRAL